MNMAVGIAFVLVVAVVGALLAYLYLFREKPQIKPAVKEAVIPAPPKKKEPTLKENVNVIKAIADESPDVVVRVIRKWLYADKIGKKRDK